MSLKAHLTELQRKHTVLEEEIASAMKSPSVDDLIVAQLKRQKLALKDEIEKVAAQVVH